MNIEDSIAAYKSAESFDDIKRMNIAFLRGDMQATTYHLGPLNSESAPLVDKLIQINELDYITTCSQPGGRFSGTREQRFYVDGILPRKYVSMFIHRMYARCSTAFIMIMDNEFTKDEYNLLTKSNLYWVTRCGKCLCWSNCQKDKYETHIPEYTYPCEPFYECDVYDKLVENHVIVYIMDTRWCHEGTEILDTAIEVLKELREN